MRLSKREKWIAIAAVATFGAFLADSWVLSPLYGRYRADVEQAAMKQQEVLRATQLVKRRQAMQAEWQRRQAAGLVEGASQAEAAMLNALETWAEQARLGVTSIRPDRRPSENGFQVIRCRVSLTGPMEGFAQFCWQLEHAAIPLRAEKIQLSSADATRDALGIQLDVSTVCLARPAAGKKEP